MAKGIFKIQIILSGNKDSIKDIADKLVVLYKKLAEFDTWFQCPRVSVSYEKNETLDLFKLNKEECTLLLSNYILSNNLSDIRQYEKINHPTTEYQRESGFRCSMGFGQKSNELHFYHIMGCSEGNCIFTLSAGAHDFRQDFNWYYSVLQIFVDHFDAIRAGINITTSSFLEETKQYSYPLGWITYFSNDFELKIPDNLDDFECVFTEKGKYLIATREDFTINTKVYQEQKNKLLKAMEYISKTVSGYI